jgi:energy-coupling factor transporter ATP-binding protein EcfA2
MIAFPVCERLQIEGYGLFPGPNKDHQVDISLNPGLTLVLGANGLGKTTLITLLFRLLTGPSDLRDRSGDSIGTTSLSPVTLPTERRREFADRVHDGAEHATEVVPEIRTVV